MNMPPSFSSEAPEEALQAEDSVVAARRPARPSKAAGAFRTISEVADELDVQQHVLRFWETKFSQIRPLKRGGGRRYYRPEDVTLLKKIHHLLYTEKYTIKGVQKLLKEKGKARLLEDTTPAENFTPANEVQKPQPQDQKLNERQRAVLRSTLDDLKALRDIVHGGS